ncbi:hypothetical protein [Streptomyces sp. C1-2]|uniref:hypothetical protein n=1 Tax=Streptomyces sp. C1-2 TaxID=2720022 RepID=UPI0014326397|nr:hypothetical protein [Streptomyces sp. C1-2]NJP72319.1 hypothetical protein [Streptomyces sp. C1-2]
MKFRQFIEEVGLSGADALRNSFWASTEGALAGYAEQRRGQGAGHCFLLDWKIPEATCPADLLIVSE